MSGAAVDDITPSTDAKFEEATAAPRFTPLLMLLVVAE